MQIVYVLDNEIRYVTNSHNTLGVVYISSSPNLQVSGLDVDSRNRCVYWSSGKKRQCTNDNRISKEWKPTLSSNKITLFNEF